MTHFDIFNGDADGIFSLIQLRKSDPIDSQKITGIKRDVALLSRCLAEQGDSVTVLDISMETNLSDLKQLLSKGVKIFYADHHKINEIPDNQFLESHIDLDANTCTSLIIDSYLDGRYRSWAIAGAFGDNLDQKANQMCKELGYSTEESEFLKELGVLVNYNGYGEHIDDLHFAPAELFQSLFNFSSPFDLKSEPTSPYFSLKAAFEADMANMSNISPTFSNKQLDLYILPDEASSRRISGVFGNRLIYLSPEKAQLILTTNKDQSYKVSLRAPLNNKQGADVICSQFDTGGGRAAAAGINKFDLDRLDELVGKTAQFYL